MQEILAETQKSKKSDGRNKSAWNIFPKRNKFDENARHNKATNLLKTQQFWRAQQIWPKRNKFAQSAISLTKTQDAAKQ